MTSDELYERFLLLSASSRESIAILDSRLRQITDAVVAGSLPADFIDLSAANVATLQEAYDSLSDQRTLDEAKAEAVTRVKSDCNEYILAEYPYYTQINAALGLREDSEIIKAFIQNARNACDALEATIASCTTNAEADAVVWEIS